MNKPKPNWQAARLGLNAQRAIELLQEIERAYTVDKPSEIDVKALNEIRQAIEHIKQAATLLDQSR